MISQIWMHPLYQSIYIFFIVPTSTSFEKEVIIYFCPASTLVSIFNCPYCSYIIRKNKSQTNSNCKVFVHLTLKKHCYWGTYMNTLCVCIEGVSERVEHRQEKFNHLLESAYVIAKISLVGGDSVLV